jgi:trk system potassium uptake protein
MGWGIEFCLFSYGFVLSRNKISRDEAFIGWWNIKIQTITFYNKCNLCNIYSILISLFIIFGHINILDSISLSFGTLSSGGFVPTSTILNSVNSSTLIIIMGEMIIAALPFAFHFGIFSKEKKLQKKLKKY